ncbi:MAG: geranyl transferase [Gammaproteobacteria bacterium]|nr:geranyl transferase [Gammaproteobacteria bacterium]
MSKANTTDVVEEVIVQFNEVLLESIPSAQQDPVLLHQAMHYVLFNGGKRLRPLLVYFTGQIFNTQLQRLHSPACAVELLHAYSLVHDDLPAMDDDDYRRGKLSCHKAFDEATAILVGDALQALAFSLLSATHFSQLSAQKKLDMVYQLSIAVGSQGMVGGQSLDLLSEGKQLSLDKLNKLHHWKTGALIQASVELGIIASDNVNEPEAIRLREFAHCLGLGFQIQDDIKDVVGDINSLGKKPKGDMAKKKATYPAMIGLDQAKDSLIDLQKKAEICLEPFGNSATGLRSLLRSIDVPCF